ncbi:hypothetical protein ACM25O_13180 [Sulfitobacter pontiacus]
MGAGSIIGLVWTVVSRGFSGAGLSDTADRIVDRLAALRDAKSEVEKAEIERDIVQLQAIQALQTSSSQRAFSPMMIGQYLIVIPYGLWWAAIFMVSILNKNIGTAFVIDNIPPHIFAEAKWLIPAIIIGTILERRK